MVNEVRAGFELCRMIPRRLIFFASLRSASPSVAYAMLTRNFLRLARGLPISQVLVFLASFSLPIRTNWLDICLRRATLYPAELRVRATDHLADWRQVGNGLGGASERFRVGEAAGVSLWPMSRLFRLRRSMLIRRRQGRSSRRNDGLADRP